jgi:hypothetical protein
MATGSPPAGSEIDDVFPAWWKNNLRPHPAFFPADGGEGRATKAKQEAAPRWLSSESTAPTPQRGAHRVSTSCLRQADDASALAGSLLDVTLVPETTVQSVPDVTSSPLVDRKVPTDSHPTSFRFSLNPPGVRVEASSNPLGFRTRSPWDRLTDVSTYGPSGSEEDDEPSICWDFSGLGNPSAMRDFMTACDYCLSDCSDGSRSLDNEDCGPSRECFHVDLGGPSEGNHLGMPEVGDLPRPVPRVDIPRELAVVPVPAGGHDPQLVQIRGV